jgi:magnesium transporter
VAVARAGEDAATVLDRIRAATPAFHDVVYVVDGDGRVEGAVSLGELLAAHPGQSVSRLARPARPLHADRDQEHIASHALHHALTAVPVTSAQGVLLGVVPPEALMRILRREHVEDLHRLAGIGAEGELAREAIEAPPLRRARDRLPWLLAGLAGSVVATSVMAAFEARLEQMVALAFFVPAIVYLADAIGTQTEAIAVRGLSLSHMAVRDLVWGELRTGMIMGATLGSVAWPAVWLAIGDMRLASAVALSLVVAGALATTVGLLLPWALARTGRDPAFGSGPLATIIQDTVSLLIYFAIASLLLF